MVRRLDTAEGIHGLYSLLLLVSAEVGPSWEPTETMVESWTLDQREEVRQWASAEYLYASDNPVRRKPMPSVLKGESPQ